MEKEPLNLKQTECIEKLTKHLPVLRASIRITQQDIADKIGVTRQSIMLIETRRRKMKWTTYLALIFVFEQFEESNILLHNLKIFDNTILKDIEN